MAWGVVFGFEVGEFFDAADVAALADGGVEEDFDDLANLVFAEQVGAEADDIAVIVFAGAVGGYVVVDEGGADAADFVGGDAHADAGTVEEDAHFADCVADGESGGDGEVGVIDAAGTLAAEVLDFVAHLLEKGNKLALGFEATMITGHGDLHRWFSTRG